MVPPRYGSMTSPMVPGPMRPVTRPIFPVRLRSMSLRTMACPESLRAGRLGLALGVFTLPERRCEGRKVVASLRQDSAQHLVDALAAVQDGHLANMRERFGRCGNDGRHVLGKLLGDDRVLVGTQRFRAGLDAVGLR